MSSLLSSKINPSDAFNFNYRCLIEYANWIRSFVGCRQFRCLCGRADRHWSSVGSCSLTSMLKTSKASTVGSARSRIPRPSTTSKRSLSKVSNTDSTEGVEKRSVITSPEKSQVRATTSSIQSKVQPKIVKTVKRKITKTVPVEDVTKKIKSPTETTNEKSVSKKISAVVNQALAARKTQAKPKLLSYKVANDELPELKPQENNGVSSKSQNEGTTPNEVPKVTDLKHESKLLKKDGTKREARSKTKAKIESIEVRKLSASPKRISIQNDTIAVTENTESTKTETVEKAMKIKKKKKKSKTVEEIEPETEIVEPQIIEKSNSDIPKNEPNIVETVIEETEKKDTESKKTKKKKSKKKNESKESTETEVKFPDMTEPVEEEPAVTAISDESPKTTKPDIEVETKIEEPESRVKKEKKSKKKKKSKDSNKKELETEAPKADVLNTDAPTEDLKIVDEQEVEVQLDDVEEKPTQSLDNLVPLGQEIEALEADPKPAKKKTKKKSKKSKGDKKEVLETEFPVTEPVKSPTPQPPVEVERSPSLLSPTPWKSNERAKSPSHRPSSRLSLSRGHSPMPVKAPSPLSAAKRPSSRLSSSRGPSPKPPKSPSPIPTAKSPSQVPPVETLVVPEDKPRVPTPLPPKGKLSTPPPQAAEPALTPPPPQSQLATETGNNVNIEQVLKLLAIKKVPLELSELMQLLGERESNYSDSHPTLKQNEVPEITIKESQSQEDLLEFEDLEQGIDENESSEFTDPLTSALRKQEELGELTSMDESESDSDEVEETTITQVAIHFNDEDALEVSEKASNSGDVGLEEEEETDDYENTEDDIESDEDGTSKDEEDEGDPETEADDPEKPLESESGGESDDEEAEESENTEEEPTINHDTKEASPLEKCDNTKLVGSNESSNTSGESESDESEESEGMEESEKLDKEKVSFVEEGVIDNLSPIEAPLAKLEEIQSTEDETSAETDDVESDDSNDTQTSDESEESEESTDDESTKSPLLQEKEPMLEVTKVDSEESKILEQDHILSGSGHETESESEDSSDDSSDSDSSSEDESGAEVPKPEGKNETDVVTVVTEEGTNENVKTAREPTGEISENTRKETALVPKANEHKINVLEEKESETSDLPLSRPSSKLGQIISNIVRSLTPLPSTEKSSRPSSKIEQNLEGEGEVAKEELLEESTLEEPTFEETVKGDIDQELDKTNISDTNEKENEENKSLIEEHTEAAAAAAPAAAADSIDTKKENVSRPSSRLGELISSMVRAFSPIPSTDKTSRRSSLILENTTEEVSPTVAKEQAPPEEPNDKLTPTEIIGHVTVEKMEEDETEEKIEIENIEEEPPKEKIETENIEEEQPKEEIETENTEEEQPKEAIEEVILATKSPLPTLDEKPEESDLETCSIENTDLSPKIIDEANESTDKNLLEETNEKEVEGEVTSLESSEEKEENNANDFQEMSINADKTIQHVDPTNIVINEIQSEEQKFTTDDDKDDDNSTDTAQKPNGECIKDVVIEEPAIEAESRVAEGVQSIKEEIEVCKSFAVLESQVTTSIVNKEDDKTKAELKEALESIQEMKEKMAQLMELINTTKSPSNPILKEPEPEEPMIQVTHVEDLNFNISKDALMKESALKQNEEVVAGVSEDPLLPVFEQRKVFELETMKALIVEAEKNRIDLKVSQENVPSKCLIPEEIKDSESLVEMQDQEHFSDESSLEFELQEKNEDTEESNATEEAMPDILLDEKEEFETADREDEEEIVIDQTIIIENSSLTKADSCVDSDEHSILKEETLSDIYSEVKKFEDVSENHKNDPDVGPNDPSTVLETDSERIVQCVNVDIESLPQPEIEENNETKDMKTKEEQTSNEEMDEKFDTTTGGQTEEKEENLTYFGSDDFLENAAEKNAIISNNTLLDSGIQINDSADGSNSQSIEDFEMVEKAEVEKSMQEENEDSAKGRSEDELPNITCKLCKDRGGKDTHSHRKSIEDLITFFNVMTHFKNEHQDPPRSRSGSRDRKERRRSSLKLSQFELDLDDKNYQSSPGKDLDFDVPEPAPPKPRDYIKPTFYAKPFHPSYSRFNQSQQDIVSDNWMRQESRDEFSKQSYESLVYPESLMRCKSESNLKKTLKFSVSMKELDTDTLTISFDGENVNISSSSKVLTQSSIDVQQQGGETVFNLRANPKANIAAKPEEVDVPKNEKVEPGSDSEKVDEEIQEEIQDEEKPTLVKEDSELPDMVEGNAVNEESLELQELREESSSVDTVIDNRRQSQSEMYDVEIPPQKLFYYDDTGAEEESTAEKIEMKETINDKEDVPEVISSSGSHENIVDLYESPARSENSIEDSSQDVINEELDKELDLIATAKIYQYHGYDPSEKEVVTTQYHTEERATVQDTYEEEEEDDEELERYYQRGLQYNRFRRAPIRPGGRHRRFEPILSSPQVWKHLLMEHSQFSFCNFIQLSQSTECFFFLSRLHHYQPGPKSVKYSSLGALQLEKLQSFDDMSKRHLLQLTGKLSK